jgi:hypothetical protein
VTGCGYPDIATRALVSRLAQMIPTATVVGLCDYNPHGLALLLTYRFPSKASIFEGEGMYSDLKWCAMRGETLRKMLGGLHQQHHGGCQDTASVYEDTQLNVTQQQRTTRSPAENNNNDAKDEEGSAGEQPPSKRRKITADTTQHDRFVQALKPLSTHDTRKIYCMLQSNPIKVMIM